MATSVQFRRGTKAQHDNFTGAAGEMTAEMTNNRLVLHDGVLAGGHPHLRVSDFQGQAGTYYTATGSGNAFAITPDPAISAYAAGQRFAFKANHAINGAATLNVNGKGAKTIKKNGGADDLTTNDIKGGQIVVVAYDGINFQMISALGEFIAGSNLVHIREQQTSGTEAGTFTAGARRTRVLNTEVSDVGGYATLASNQITLAAGTYEAIITAPAFQVGAHKAWLRNITAGADLLTGTSENAFQTDGSTTRSLIVGRFTLGVQSVLEVQHRCGVTKTVNGLGDGGNFGTEVYTEVMLWKVG